MSSANTVLRYQPQSFVNALGVDPNLIQLLHEGLIKKKLLLRLLDVF